jgi:hypothetical protein
MSSGAVYHLVRPWTRKHSFEEGAVHALDEAVGTRRADLRRAVLDALDGEEQLVGVALRLAAEVAAIVGQHRADGDAEVLVEGQDAIVQQIARRDRHLRRVDLREGEGAGDVEDDLYVDLADALQRAPVKRVLIE